LREKGRTLEKSQIKRLDEITLMTSNTRSLLSKSVIELSAIQREIVQSRLELPKEEITLMLTINDRYLKAGALQSQTLELLADLRTDVLQTKKRNSE